jgi:hypothetical protein
LFASMHASILSFVGPNPILAAQLTLRGIYGACAYNSKVKDSKP